MDHLTLLTLAIGSFRAVIRYSRKSLTVRGATVLHKWIGRTDFHRRSRELKSLLQRRHAAITAKKLLLSAGDADV